MTTKTTKVAVVAAAAGNEKKPDELTPENTVDGNGGQNAVAGSGDVDVDLTESGTDGATGLMGAEVTRRMAFFPGSYHRYSHGDMTCFDAEYAEKLVERHIAIWSEDTEEVLSPRKGADNHDTDIG